jgi:hypothetical protein
MVNVITSGHLAVLYISGATTALDATEAMTANAGHTVFTIDDAAKHVWDPTYALTPTWSAGPAGTITKNRLTGQLYSTVDETTHTVTVTGKYLPMAAMLYAKDFSMSTKRKVVDTTAINCTSPPAYETKQGALSEVTGTIGTFFTPDAAATFDPAITEYFIKSLTGATVFALELHVSANYSLRAWVTVDTEAIKASLNNVLEETVSFRGVTDADGRVVSQI